MVAFAESADLAIRLLDVEVVETHQSPLQRVELLRHPKLGLVLVINGEMQHAEAWQALYHEPLVHLAAAYVPEVKHALVLGGGSLYAASELLRYPTLERCTLVDHDPVVLEMMARHYPHAAKVMADPRFTYVVGDALAHITNSADAFDIVINDCLDLLSAETSADLSPFAALQGLLKPEGVCADVIYRHLLNYEHINRTRNALNSLGNSAISLVIVPEYPGALHALTIWGNPNVDQAMRTPRNGIQRLWCRGVGRPELEFFDPRYLSFHLYVPPFLERAWKSLPDEGAPETEF